MKSAYELAMERLQKQAPSVKLTAAQKAAIAELDSQYAARVAQREIGLKDEILKAESHGNEEEAAKLREQLQAEKRKLQAELEEKKERVRAGKA
jgi:Skp family chaperone for outer membrane proteins